MSYIALTHNQLNPEGYWNRPLNDESFIPMANELALFDQNGYDLTVLEQKLAQANLTSFHSHRDHRYALKAAWFTQAEKVEGPFSIIVCYLNEKATEGKHSVSYNNGWIQIRWFIN